MRRVIETTSGDGLMSLTGFHKSPANYYLCLVPVALMPRLDDDDALTDESYWQRVMEEALHGVGRSNVLATYGAGDGSWVIPGWSSPSGRVRIVARSLDEAPEVCARRWLRYVDRTWLRGFEPHPDNIDAAMILTWPDRLIAVVDADSSARVVFTPGVPMGSMIAEVAGERTGHEEIWWSGWSHLTMRW